MDPRLRLAHDGAVAIVTLADPATLNSLGPDLCASLIGLFEALAASGEVRAAVLTGEGRAFSSGGNLLDIAKAADGAGDVQDYVERLYNPLAETLRGLPFPLVTAINGVAAGIGCAYALAGDLVIAAESASFNVAFRRIGLVPDGGSTWLLPRLIGHARAMEMVMLGETIAAPRALEWGMINRCVPDAELPAAALALAHRLAEGPAALVLARRLMWKSSEASWSEQLAAEAVAQGAASRTQDFREGVASFLEKRGPRFSGR